MMQKLILFFVSTFLSCSIALQNTSSTSFSQLYHDGVSAYLDEDWPKCIDDLEASIHKYKLTLTAIADCRIKCLNEPHDHFIKKDIEDLMFFEKIVKRTLCFVKCKRIRYPNVEFDFSTDVKDILVMEELTPYSYLHICYYNNNLVQKAASAAFTYIVKTPNDKLMKNNLEFYLTLPDVDPREITNYEMPEYVPLYFHGINAYNNEDWDQSVAYMEEALAAYVAGEQRCRALCEGSFDQGWLPDFISSIANHFTYCLKCKAKCPEKLKSLSGKKGKEILADIYNYLQFSYYKLKKFPKTYRSVASYLLIYPSDQEMIQNKKFYSNRANPEEFTPRTEIVHYLQRENDEMKLLQFIHQSFVAEFELEQSKNNENTNDIETNSIM